MPVEHVTFPSIEQYRNVCKLVRERAQHDGLPLPILTFFGSVKLHGANSGGLEYSPLKRKVLGSTPRLSTIHP
jgi:hypothetical protein